MNPCPEVICFRAFSAFLPEIRIFSNIWFAFLSHYCYHMNGSSQQHKRKGPEYENSYLFLFCSIVMIMLFMPGFSYDPDAVCTHRFVSDTEYESGHPHAQYVYCTSCGEKIYTGSYATKSHSSCSKCGTHSYSGTTCTQKGTCVCGYQLPMTYYVPNSVQYYDYSGNLIYSQSMTWSGPDLVYNTNPSEIFSLSTKPAYTTASALFWLDESVSAVNIPITTYFDYSN